jgi:hypothetical protein
MYTKHVFFNLVFGGGKQHLSPLGPWLTAFKWILGDAVEYKDICHSCFLIYSCYLSFLIQAYRTSAADTIFLTSSHVYTLAVPGYADIRLTVDHVVLQRVKVGAARWTRCLRRSPPVHSTSVSTLTGGPQLRRQMLLEQWRPSKVGLVLGHMTVVINLLVQLVRLPQVCLLQWEACENIFLMRINKCTYTVHV